MPEACGSGIGCGLGRDLASTGAGGAAVFMPLAAGAGTKVVTPVGTAPDDGAGRATTAALAGGAVPPVAVGRPLAAGETAPAAGDGRGGSGAALRVVVEAASGGLAIAPTPVRSGRDTG
jgi:hypothetical protein